MTHEDNIEMYFTEIGFDTVYFIKNGYRLVVGMEFSASGYEHLVSSAM
jgi:hypothetical protein